MRYPVVIMLKHTPFVRLAPLVVSLGFEDPKSTEFERLEATRSDVRPRRGPSPRRTRNWSEDYQTNYEDSACRTKPIQQRTRMVVLAVFAEIVCARHHRSSTHSDLHPQRSGACPTIKTFARTTDCHETSTSKEARILQSHRFRDLLRVDYMHACCVL